MYRKTYLEIDGNILQNNVKEIINNYSNYEYYFGVVKANAYGHGEYIVNDLIKGGINYLATSSLEEALSIRKYNKVIPILCLEPVSLDYINLFIDNNITATVSDYAYFNKLNSLDLKKEIKIHIKLDTGMNRLGINNKKELDNVFKIKNKNIIIEGIYTHFATTGIYDKYWDKQLYKFKYLLKDIDLTKIKIIHAGRSLTLVNHPKIDICNGIRLGIIMYGINGSIKENNNLKSYLRKIKYYFKNKKLNISETYKTNNLKLSTAFKLISEVIAIKKIAKGDIVGYGNNYIAIDNEVIATIPIGYADGISLGNKYVLINNKKYKIIGNICMDMISVKVDNTVKQGDKVIIIGDNISIKEIASNMHSNAYRVFTSITNRVPRIHISGKNKTEIKY